MRVITAMMAVLACIDPGPFALSVAQEDAMDALRA